MKIRCNNCYKVLKKNEEYCTHCGTHSEKMHDLMVYGTTEIDSAQEFKSSILWYLAIGFLGTGIFTIALALVYNNFSSYAWDWILQISKYNSLLVTSIILLIIMLLSYRKELGSMLFNGNKKEFLGALLIGVITVVSLFIFSKLTTFTRVIPEFITSYLEGGERYITGGGGISVFGLFISFFAMVIVEEIIIRRRLIDYLDDDTLFGDTAIVIVSALAGTLMHFLWVMTVETLIMTFILNIVMSVIYINTNRSIGVNVILRVILLVLLFIL